MAYDNSRDNTSNARSKDQRDLAGVASQAYSAASAVASDAANKAKDLASDTAASIGSQLKEMLDRQVGSGAEAMGHVVGSTKRFADELNRESPQVASFVRAVADRADTYVNDLRGQSAEQLMRRASDYTRRQPALVFGLAALAGFFALRAFKNTPTVSSPSIQPTDAGGDRTVRQSHAS